MKKPFTTTRFAIRSNGLIVTGPPPMHAKLGYQLLYRHVGLHNPNSAANIKHVLGLCSSELSKIVTRHLAGIELHEADDNEFAVFDLPPELNKIEPQNFDLIDVERLKLDL